MKIETTILSNLINNEEYARKMLEGIQEVEIVD